MTSLERAAWRSRDLVIMSPSVLVAGAIMDRLNLSEGGKYIPDAGRRLIEMLEEATGVMEKGEENK